MPLTSPIYWSPWIYRATMRLLYGKQVDERYRIVDRLVPDGARVVELCCGCGYLYEHFLRHRGVRYHGIDLLPHMTSRLRQLGAKVEQADVREAPVPAAEYVLMLGSLYHFHPDEAGMLRKMAASGTGIVLEPLKNFSQSANPLVQLGARTLTHIGGSSSHRRLTAPELAAALAQAGVRLLEARDELEGRYRLLVFTAG